MSQSPKIKILLADDHTMFRDGVKQVLSEVAGFAVVDEASTAAEVLEKVQHTQMRCRCFRYCYARKGRD